MTFQKAQPVWIADQTSLSQFLGFYANAEQSVAGTAQLQLAAVNEYRLWHNGQFVAQGPARCAHGHARIDVIELDLVTGANHLAIEVAAYHMNSYSQLDQPGFLCAELSAGTQVIAATGDDFQVQVLEERLCEVQRYSFQRPTSEAYCLNATSQAWHTSGISVDKQLSLQAVDGYEFLERHAPAPNYEIIEAGIVSAWHCTYALSEDYRQDRAQKQTGGKLKGCLTSELELNVCQLMDGCDSEPAPPLTNDILPAGGAVIYDLARNRSGFIQAEILCRSTVHVLISYDERLDEAGDIDFLRMDCLNVLSYQLEPGTYQLESFAPYTARYMKLHVIGGDVQLQRCGMRTYENAQMFFDVETGDAELNEISIAAQHTIAQNSVDIFMDCPSRERAGWLCDSFFMGRYERALVKNTGVERDFLENFLLPDSFAYLPAGMLPMCYPADFTDGNFIPQWSLWYVLEFVEYMESQASDTVGGMAALAKDRLLKLFAWFAAYENEDGLLEDLPGWNFIEWSKANTFVAGVNYPSNMLYVAALRAYGNFFGMGVFNKKADAIQKNIIEQAWDGEWFRDQATRTSAGGLMVMEHRTEVCQYYALTFGIKPDGWKELWQRLLIHFGSHYVEGGMYHDIYPANAFIGYVLRIDLLQAMEDPSLCLEEIKGLYGHMARTTGTLWEHKDTSASCNHGFAGYIALKIQQLTR